MTAAGRRFPLPIGMLMEAGDPLIYTLVTCCATHDGTPLHQASIAEWEADLAWRAHHAEETGAMLDWAGVGQMAAALMRINAKVDELARAMVGPAPEKPR
jgi:hypothetical protein